MSEFRYNRIVYLLNEKALMIVMTFIISNVRTYDLKVCFHVLK